MSCEIERAGDLGSTVAVGVPRDAVSPGGGALYSGGSSYSAMFPVLPGAQGLAQLPDVPTSIPKNMQQLQRTAAQAQQAAQQIQQASQRAAQKAKELGLEIPGAKEIAEEINITIPGLPVSADTVTGLVTGDIQVEDLVREAAFRVADAVVPGLGVALSTAWPQIEEWGGKAIDFATGQPEKRERRKRNYRAIRQIFNYTMDMYPLAMYKTDRIPSPDFLQLFRRNMAKPELWQRLTYLRKRKIPGWLHSKSRFEDDYEGSGLRRRADTYYERVQIPDEILKMLKKYYELPGKNELREKAIRDTIELAKKKAERRARIEKARQKSEREYGKKLAPALDIFNALKEEIKRQVSAHPEYALKKDAKGQPLGPKAYALVVISELQKRFPPKQVQEVVSPSVWKNTFQKVMEKHPEVARRVFTLAAQRKAPQQQQQAQAVTKAAAAPGTTENRRVTQALEKKTEELEKLAAERQRKARIAQRQGQSFRADLRKLQQKYAQAKTQQQKDQIRMQMDALASEYRRAMQAAAQGKELARNAATQKAIAKELTTAVRTGRPRTASSLSQQYNRLGRSSIRQKILQRLRSRRTA